MITVEQLEQSILEYARKRHCSVADAEAWQIYQARLAGVRARRVARQTAKPAPLRALKNEGYNGIWK